MNKVVLKRTGNLEINGVEIEAVFGVAIKSDAKDTPTITVQFAADEFEIEVGVEDFEWAKSTILTSPTPP